MLAAIVSAGCGKKGAPLAPFVRIPAAVETITVERVGSDAYVTLTLPARNIDASLPIDIARVDVYAYTGVTAPAAPQWTEIGSLVATIPVTAPSDPDRPPVDAPGNDAALPGAVVTVRDALGPEALQQGPMPVATRGAPGLVPVPAEAATPSLRRFYRAFPFSTRGRPGPPGVHAELPLSFLPEPPTELRATYGPAAITLTWEPSGGLLGFLLDRTLGPEAQPFDDERPVPAGSAQSRNAPEVSGPTTYRVYRDSRAPAVARSPVPPPAWSARVPMPVGAPVSALTFTDDLMEFGRERCYSVRAERGSILSEPSMPVCLTPIDTFPPQPPTGLTAVSSEGAVNLIWEPSAESDLGGYLVLRQGPGDATLRQLTESPIPDARYRDATVEAGARYIYAVVAVDRRLPAPNASEPSARVEEIAR